METTYCDKKTKYPWMLKLGSKPQKISCWAVVLIILNHVLGELLPIHNSFVADLLLCGLWPTKNHPQWEIIITVNLFNIVYFSCS